MDNPVTIILLTIAGVLVIRWIFLFVASGGDTRRIGIALNSQWRALRDPAFADKVEPLLAPPKEGPAKPDARPLRFLALLQREGRLLDFLLENIEACSDAQIVAAVREMHRQWQHALQEHLVLEPVLHQSEGATVEVPAGFDPSAIRLTGNVTGQPPFRGTLQHHGWRAKEIKLAPPPEGQDELVLMPAEVELP
jgi:hypothetical protein